MLDDCVATAADNEITFHEYFDIDIKNDHITTAEDVEIRITMVDNKGYEYQLTEDFIIGIPEEIY